MDREQILDVFRSLACSQGFYGRLLRDIYSDEEWGNAYLKHLEEQNFRTELDLILYIES
jgi:hypothetical protein